MDLLACTPALSTICELLALTDTRSLRNLCLTNSCINRLCRVYLVYRWTNSKHCPEPSIRCFALHLQKHPELRSMVKIVDFGILRWLPPNTDWESVSSTDSKYDPHFVTLAENLRPDVDYYCPYSGPEMLEAIKRGSEDALVIAILAWCKRITHLTMAIPEFDVDDPQSLYIWAFRFANEICFQSSDVRKGGREASDSPLAQLQYVELMPGNPETPVYWKVVTPFICLPKVKSLVAWRLCDAGFIKDIWEMATGAPEDDDDNLFGAESRVSNVEELMLMHAGLSVEGLGEFHYLLPGLKKLTLQPCNDYDYFDMPDFDDLADYLTQYGESLEALDLNFNPIPGRCPHDSSYPPFIENPVAETVYRNCTQLRRLSCPMMGLFTDGDDSSDGNWNESGYYEITIVLDRLPKSIEYLKPRRRHFVEDWFHNRPPVKVYIDGFIELLREAAPGRRLSNLKVLDLSETFVDDPDTDGIDKIKELAEIQGIKLLLAKRQA
ncbi:unnamed protein product [Fusarium equiseti]|uniref:F-box domain-containing protein n=1 Tax=Fusarium equiseti TaxID=61235 RepID=A0A8J2IQR9_FUSEQ|nr:unnamed protein product [Fusarium equiseti]